MSTVSFVRPTSSAQREILAAIGRVVELCRSAQPDPTIDHEIRQLDALKSAIEDHWPLSPDIKNRIDIGPFAAKNIADWNPALADALMHLDYDLQHAANRSITAWLPRIPPEAR